MFMYKGGIQEEVCTASRILYYISRTTRPKLDKSIEKKWGADATRLQLPIFDQSNLIITQASRRKSKRVKEENLKTCAL